VLGAGGRGRRRGAARDQDPAIDAWLQ